ncbi:MAG: 6-carboxy-5,6,7,8-tetrahydropterin synthase [Firmicutes bacterium]|nr:6-carboxy-5,6,7,8-tetrahydropterin synthase [Bacillota bacterium]
MYYVIKRLEISASHSLKLNYSSKCDALHGHNWIITIHCRSENLDQHGMVTDFTHIKEEISGKLDHKNLDDILPFNSTAENLAKWLCDQVFNCYRVEIQESEGNTAIYESS